VSGLEAQSAGTPSSFARLPAGRHRIPDQQVRDHQRARLIDAVTQLSAELGYANIVIADIVARAAVSKSTFYRFYRTKQECLFDAHKRHSAALIAALDRFCEGEEPSVEEQLRVAVHSALAYLDANPGATHLLTVGILACGRRGEYRYQVMIDALADRLRSAGTHSPPDSALAALLFAASMIAHRIVSREEIEQSALESELVEIFLAITHEGKFQAQIG
jgi:AcrR family transcriptional regulator